MKHCFFQFTKNVHINIFFSTHDNFVEQVYLFINKYLLIEPLSTKVLGVQSTPSGIYNTVGENSINQRITLKNNIIN